MTVEIPSHVRETASQLGDGVPYALKVLTGRLADDPDMGEPSALPGILTVMIDGDLNRLQTLEEPKLLRTV
ncbi:hypothetical protein [Streptomyces doebereineriae]|uniref:Uncharacterized protein n=1 Tax=Streptomyces doebereineriae TaxID=3075528 RepID=A0ABU2VFR5_9ACTN|nr:hypothetical protein [Streptomyces sp. DSM 41640]MDT0484397.1 hypothetical protein [Streptomyces sp. DSM 41640]